MRSTVGGSIFLRAGLTALALVLAGTAQAISMTAVTSVATPASDVPVEAAIKPVEPNAADIPFASAHAAGQGTPSATNAWGGERTGRESTLSDRVVSYQIHADLDAVKHSVTASEHMTRRNRSDREVHRVYFHLYLNGFKNDGSTWFTERHVLTAHGQSRGAASLKKGQWGWIDLKQVRQGSASLSWHYVQPDGGPATDQSVVSIDLAQPIPAGGTLTLDIDFLSQLPRVVERTGWWGRFQSGRAVVSKDWRARAGRRARCHGAAMERARVPFQQRVLRRFRQLRCTPDGTE